MELRSRAAGHSDSFYAARKREADALERTRSLQQELSEDRESAASALAVKEAERMEGAATALEGWEKAVEVERAEEVMGTRGRKSTTPAIRSHAFLRGACSLLR